MSETAQQRWGLRDASHGETGGSLQPGRRMARPQTPPSPGTTPDRRLPLPGSPEPRREPRRASPKATATWGLAHGTNTASCPGAGRKPALPWATPRPVFDGFRSAEVERFIVFSQKRILRSRSPTVWRHRVGAERRVTRVRAFRKSVLGVNGTVALAAETRNDALERRQGRGRPGTDKGPGWRWDL